MQPAIMVNGQKLIPVCDGNARPGYELMAGDETWHLAAVPGGGYRLQRYTDHWARMFPSLEGAVAYVSALEQTGRRQEPRCQHDGADDVGVWHA